MDDMKFHMQGSGCERGWKVQDVPGETEKQAGLGGLSGPVDMRPFNFGSVYTLCLFWNERRVFKRALVFVNSRRAEGGLSPCAGN